MTFRTIRWQFFVPCFLTAVSATLLFGVSSGIQNGRFTKSLFENSYEVTLQNLKDSLLTIEADMDRTALNAAYVFRELEAKRRVITEDDFNPLSSTLGVSHFYATNAQGDFILSTSNPYSTGNLNGLNIFKICPEYRTIFTNGDTYQTPIIWNKYERDIKDSFKYTLIPNYNRDRVLEVSISVRPIIEKLQFYFNSDENIKRLTLFTSSGKMLVSYPLNQTEQKLNEMELAFSRKNHSNGSILKKWTDQNELFLMTEATPLTNGGKCPECRVKGLTVDDQYFYVISALISGSPYWTSVVTNLKWTTGMFALISFLAGVASLLASRGPTRRINYVSSHFEKHQSHPSQIPLLEVDGLDEISQIATQFNSFIRHSKKAQKEQVKLVESQAQANQAKIVHHNSKTPIKAMEYLIESTPMDDQRKSEFRHQHYELVDIVNSLVPSDNDCKSNLLWSLIELTISTQKLAIKNRSDIKIETNRCDNSYYLFAKVGAQEFRGIISNIITNSIVHGLKYGGIILVGIWDEDTHIKIIVEDNGTGIPEHVLPRIFESGFNFGGNGTGLGLSQIKESVEGEWKGTVKVYSEINHGTKTVISLPKSKPPLWFVGSITLLPNTVIILVDDDPFIHVKWKNRISEINQKHCASITLVDFLDPREFRNWMNSSERSDNETFVIDLNLTSDTKHEGIAIMLDLKLNRRAYLITHKWEFKEVQEDCEKNEIAMIPKDLIDQVPMYIVREPIKYDAVVIDDRLSILRMVQQNAIREGKRVKCLFKALDFYLDAKFISKDSPIFIDHHLDANRTGEEEAWRMKELGFSYLYSTSADNKESLPANSPFNGRRSKECPWRQEENHRLIEL